MSEQRLSKLQKWILKNCYRVTVLFDRSTLKKLNNAGSARKCQSCPKTKDSVEITEQPGVTPYDCRTKGTRSTPCSYFVFYREDILLSYFSLRPDNGKAHLHRVQHFHNSPDYTKAHVSTHRSINGLVNKGLIHTGKTWKEESLTICLTSDGIKKAIELLEKERTLSSPDP